MYVARGISRRVFVAAALRGEEGGESEEIGRRMNVFGYGEKRLAPCDRFDPEHGNADGHCLPAPYIISDKPGEQLGE